MIFRRLATVFMMPALVALATFCGFLGWIQFAAREEPDAVLSVDAGQVEALLAAVEPKRLQKQMSLDEVAAIGRKILRRAPLLDAPLVYVGLKEAERGNEEAARMAFTQALSQQPRNVPALSWLAADALKHRRFDIALRHLSRLPELAQQDGTLYVAAVASFADDPNGLAVLRAALEAKSPIAVAAVERLTETSRDIPLLVTLNSGSPKGEARLVRRLMRERGPVEAFLAWISMATENETRMLKWPYDPAFVGGSFPVPFNWETTDGAQLLNEGGLYARYPGRGAPTFARQVMLLGPGRYVFRVEMDGKVEREGGGFSWRITCAPGQQVLGSIVIAELKEIMSSYAFEFDVPASKGCAAQQLSLLGRPGNLASPARTTVRRVSIDSRENTR